jgi:serine/threonine-protein kinase
MFRLLAGRRVHEADTEVERLMKVVSDPAPPLASVAPQVAQEVCAVVDRALAYDRERRYQDAASMQADVRAVARGDKSVHAAEPAATSEPAQRRMRTSGDVPSRRLDAEPPTVGPRPRPQEPPLADEGGTRAQPGYVHDLPTVAARPTSTPGTQPTASTRAVASAPVTAPMAALALEPPPVIPPAPARPISRRQPVPRGLLAAVAAGSMTLLLLIAVVVWFIASARSDSAPASDAVAPAPSALPSIASPATPPVANPMTPVAPAPPMPGHGRGHHR